MQNDNGILNGKFYRIIIFLALDDNVFRDTDVIRRESTDIGQLDGISRWKKHLAENIIIVIIVNLLG